MAIKIVLLVAMAALIFATTINGRNLPLEKATGGDVDIAHFFPFHGVFGGYRGGPGIGFGGVGHGFGNGGTGRSGESNTGGGLGTGGAGSFRSGVDNGGGRGIGRSRESNTGGRVGVGSFKRGADNGGGARGRNASGDVMLGGGNVGGGSQP